jgi:hypothetical protein
MLVPRERSKEGLLFVNKKKQKNFVTALRALGVGGSALSARPALQGG